MKAILNIGLKIDVLGDDSPFNSTICYYARQSVAVCTFHRWNYLIDWEAIRQSNTEATSIITICNADGLLTEIIRSLADALAQDCIAVYYPELDEGELIGRNADKWGDFNKEFFLMPQ